MKNETRQLLTRCQDMIHTLVNTLPGYDWNKDQKELTLSTGLLLADIALKLYEEPKPTSQAKLSIRVCPTCFYEVTLPIFDSPLHFSCPKCGAACHT
jgi:hypothetical protein